MLVGNQCLGTATKWCCVITAWVPNKWPCTSSRVFENVIAKWIFCVQQFFRPKISKVANIKTKSATIAFFSSPTFFLLALSFYLSPFVLELIGFKKPAMWRLFTQMTSNFVRFLFKTSVRHTCRYSISPCQALVWDISLAASTKLWATPELTKIRRTQRPFAYFWARIQGLFSGTGTMPEF